MKKYKISLDVFYLISNRLINDGHLSMPFRSMLEHRRRKILGIWIDRVCNSLGL